MKKFLALTLLLLTTLASANTPPAGSVVSRTYSGDGTLQIGGTTVGGNIGLYVYDINPTSAPVNTQTIVGGSAIDPRQIRALLFSSDSVASHTKDGAGNSITSTLVSGHQAMDVNAVGVTTATVADEDITGTLTAACPTGSGCPAGSTIELDLNGVSAGIADISGTWVGTIVVDGSTDGFATFRNVSLWTPPTGFINSGVTTSGLYRTAAIAGFKQIRLRTSALTSGSATAQLRASVGVATVVALSPNPTSNQSQIFGSSALPIQQDGSGNLFAAQAGIWSLTNISGIISLPTNAAQETGGHLATIDSGITTVDTDIKATQPRNITQFGGNNIVTGTGAAGVGIPRMTVSNDSKVLIWDSTNTATVKPASTGAIATDTALVVAVSPNNSVAVTQATASNLNAQVVGNSASGASDSGDPVKIGAVFNTTQPTVTNTQRVDLQATSRGGLIVATGADNFNINNISGVISLPTGASTETTLAKLTQTQGSTTSGQSGPLIQGAVTTAPPSYSTGQTSPLSLTTAGGLRIDTSSIAGTATATGNGVVGAGVQRVAIASDNTAFSVNAIQSTSPWVDNLTQVGGSAVTLGQKAMSASFPVVLSSDQSGINTFLDQTASGTITTTCSTPTTACPAGSFVALSIHDIAQIQTQITGSFTGATMNVDGTADGTNWVSLLTATGATGTFSTSSFSTVGKYRVFRVSGFQQVRVRASALSTGSVSVNFNASQAAGETEAVQLNPSNFTVGIFGSNSGTQTQVAVDSSGRVAIGLNDSAGAAITLGQKTMASSIPMVLSSDQTGINTFLDKNSTGNIVATNGAVSIATNGTGDTSINITGTWSATLQFEASNDSGATYPFSINASAISGGALSTSTTSNGAFKVQSGGYTNVRVRASTLASGTATVTLNTGAGNGIVRVYQNNPASLATQIYGSATGSAIKTDASSNLIVVGAVASGSADSGAPVKIGGVYNSTAVAPANGDRIDTQASSDGSILVASRFTPKYQSGAAAAVTQKTGEGILHTVCYVTPVNGSTIQFWDNTTNSGTVITLITPANGSTFSCAPFDAQFSTGLTYTTTGTGQWTFTYR